MGGDIVLTLAEHLADHVGSKPPRTRTIEGIEFHRIARRFSLPSYWIAERDGIQAFVTPRLHGNTFIVTVGGETLSSLVRTETRALERAAKDLLRRCSVAAEAT